MEIHNSPKRCTKCILPETIEGIKFDADHVCEFCLNNKTHPVIGEIELQKILKTKKGENFDCVVPFSGGKDSTYVLYYAVKNLNLRAIAVNYDSGFQSDLSRENMETTCKVLNVPLIYKNANRNLQLAMLKEILRISELNELFFHICGNCEVNIRSSAISVAKKHKIPFILYGSSFYEDFDQSKFLNMLGTKAFCKRILSRPKKIWPEIFYRLVKYSIYSAIQRMEMGVPLKYCFSLGKLVPFDGDGYKAIYFYDYIQWDLINKIRLLEENLGWKYPENRVHRFDCLLHAFGNYHWIHEAGISCDGFNFAAMVRENKMTRDDALVADRKVIEEVEDECSIVLKKLGFKNYQFPTMKKNTHVNVKKV